MRRQPGSALKPLAVYGPALELGYTTASVLLDEKTSFGGYTPRNAGDRYYGLVTMRTAIRNSLNTTAVRLLEEIGLMHRFNISTKWAFRRGTAIEISRWR
ncbi:MAG: penicillin-binding transpeptidase domain-containing protein [Christensenellales bacterium]